MMAVDVFVDTNILLRATIDRFPEHTAARALLLQQRESGAILWISRQVIREILVQVTRTSPFTLEPILSIDQAEAMVLNFHALYRIADDTAAVTDKLFALLKQYPTGGKQIHDANIVATMLANGITRLITLNVADMKRFTSIEIISLPPSS
ncbi:MAG: type II toxin-antitoxin system VapC family toxin [Anaerolineae bacterium]